MSTGPRTAEGLARIRQANTRHGRYSQEHLALAKLRREFQRNGLQSARAFRDPRMRDRFLQIAWAEDVPPRILEEMREMVRADIAWRDQQRLLAKN